MDVFRYGEDDLLRMAEAVGARSLNAAEVLGGHVERRTKARRPSPRCATAPRNTDCSSSWSGWRGPGSPTWRRAWEVVRGADRPNGGLNIDTWHCARTGTTPDDLRALPGDRVLAIQLSDAPATVRGEPDRRDLARPGAPGRR